MATPRHHTAQRGAEARVVEAIARAGERGISAQQLADALGMLVTSVRWWLTRLMAAGQVESPPDRVDVGGLRAQRVYRMARAQRGGMHARPARVRVDDRVVTPSDRVAVVIELDEDDGVAELQYVEGDPGGHASVMAVSLSVSLLAPWPKGAERPHPVRLGTLPPERRPARGAEAR